MKSLKPKNQPFPAPPFSSGNTSPLRNTIVFPASLRHDFFVSFVSQMTSILEKQKQNNESSPVNILINSQGGCLRTAFALRNYISSLRKQGVIIRTIVPSFAYSAGLYIAASGSKGYRLAYPEAELMVHAIQSFLFGDFYSDVKKNYKRLSRDMKIYLSSLAFEMAKDENNEVTRENHLATLNSLEQMCQNNGTWLNAQEAKEKGFIDQVTTPLFKPQKKQKMDFGLQDLFSFEPDPCYGDEE